MMNLEQAIKHAEYIVNNRNDAISVCCSVKELEQLTAWLSILKKAKFEYDEAWRIITHPTPDVTYTDRERAQMILDTFRNSLGRME